VYKHQKTQIKSHSAATKTEQSGPWCFRSTKIIFFWGPFSLWKIEKKIGWREVMRIKLVAYFQHATIRQEELHDYDRINRVFSCERNPKNHLSVNVQLIFHHLYDYSTVSDYHFITFVNVSRFCTIYSRPLHDYVSIYSTNQRKT